ncbi:endonuclease/exonuclease/phosphatase family protein [Corynebacterium lowii]|uniref:Maltose 6'-phosphate phosphatase n=1 Tax=Corynebacterium lowii TaxID=1544413 RepID=A0A0Q0U5W6_9CORY|nr:endonuclease/exonuclease/phosphatase family protein [Corynebacterium lowii]KQB87454.1 Maltose 6'-phosphate phosphatase [Corynebacterium lowii]MDP9851953.1 maltose 6'-phosphate phosphatase [Corynebacterium lowii]
MKFLSLNAHSWCEADQPAKIMDTARLIVAEGIDVVALQEANQLQESVPWRSPRFRGPSTLEIGADNYAQALAEACAHLGEEYACYWVEAHQGFGKYDEGVGLLVRTSGSGLANARLADAPTVTEVAILVLAEHPYEDVRRRVALAAKVDPWGWVISGHFSWWRARGEELFAGEWGVVDSFAAEHAGERICVLGDLNSPCTVEGEGYSLVRAGGWIDTRDEALLVEGHDTMGGKIAGWEGCEQGARIDYALVNTPVRVDSHRVVFDGKNTPVVSDHYGIVVELDVDGEGE